jgi:hypothetical protein
VGAAPVPGTGGLTLNVNGTLDGNSTLQFQVTGAVPNQAVVLVRGATEQTAATCPPQLGGLCVDIVNAVVLRTATANAAGTASFSINVPATLPEGATHNFQAAQGGATPGTSNVVHRYNPWSTAAAPTGLGSYNVTLVEVATVAAGTGLQGVHQETFNATQAAGVDACTILGNEIGTGLTTSPPCPACLFAYDVTISGFVDVSDFGDCDDVLGLVPSTIQSFGYGIGFARNYTPAGYPTGNYAMTYSTTSAAWLPITSAQFSNGTFAWGGIIPTAYSY